jgi:hypothetical protein
MLYSLALCSVKGVLLLFSLDSCTLHFRDVIFPLASHANPHFQGLLFALVLYPPNFRAHCSPWMSCLHFQGLCWLACFACYVQGVFCPVACLASHVFAGPTFHWPALPPILRAWSSLWSIWAAFPSLHPWIWLVTITHVPFPLSLKVEAVCSTEMLVTVC